MVYEQSRQASDPYTLAHPSSHYALPIVNTRSTPNFSVYVLCRASHSKAVITDEILQTDSIPSAKRALQKYERRKIGDTHVLMSSFQGRRTVLSCTSNGTRSIALPSVLSNPAQYLSQLRHLNQSIIRGYSCLALVMSKYKEKKTPPNADFWVKLEPYSNADVCAKRKYMRRVESRGLVVES